MKKEILLFGMLFVLITSVYGATVNLDSASGPFTGYDNQYIYEYDYSLAAVTVAYNDVDDNFKAHISAHDLKPKFTYQVKLEGKGSCSTGNDFSSNEIFGLNGRWWYNGNRDDTYYDLHKNEECITGYLVFGYFTTDEGGNAEADVETGSSYHVLFCDDASLTNADLYDVFISGAKCSPAKLCPALSVNPQIERPSFSNLPEGEYSGIIELTEESFHQSCGSWTTVMVKDISFKIDNWQIPEFNAIAALIAVIGGILGFAILRKK